MIALIAAILILVNMIFPKSKYAYYPLLIFMWIIMAFTYNISDESIYMSRYNSPDLWNGQSELLFALSVVIFRKIGCNFVQYKAIMSIFILLLINSTIRKYSKYPNLVLVLFLLSPFALNVAQLRNALATSIFVFSARYLFDKDKSIVKFKKFSLTENDIKYICLIIIATMFHTAALIWLILLVAKKCSIRTNILVATISIIMFVFVITPRNIIRIIPNFGAVTRMSSYLTTEYAQSEWRHYSQILWVLFVGVITITFAYFELKKTPRFTIKHDRVEYLLKSNIVILSILGIMLIYTQEVYRLQEGMAVVNYLLVTNCIDKGSFKIHKISRKNLKTFATAVSYSVGMMYFGILHYLIQPILIPILNYNHLFDIMK